MKHIVLTGGGTAGHVTPNIALIPALKKAGYEISYIGSYNGMEKQLIEAEGIPYYGIATGKLRRYMDIKNFTDPFRVLKGIVEARRLIRRLKPDVVFSKGGFVAVPVVLASGKQHVPTLIHESDMTPGLANRICIPYATKVCCNFPETAANIPNQKAVVTGTPLRAELLKGDAEKGRAFTGLTADKPVILVMGGSLGSVNVNNSIRGALDELLKNFQIVHLCGKDHLDADLEGTEGYRQYEYIREELPDLFAMCDYVISRAGANAICELLALAKPNILIPLSAQASRGDQILNAHSFEKQGFSIVLEEENLTKETLLDAVEKLTVNKEMYIRAMTGSGHTDAIETILSLIEEISK
ncbi:MAG: undecaprenyldiphospho-muramoylpentapeptide beta-N-acetylglucosaminyltransferase [Eubacteriales bacterium]|nr:undecaprenyldiphospho-muramoylpentapeptide beta-N-acetylglucosaminyltransferase [Eubacteriales bacterium]